MANVSAARRGATGGISGAEWTVIFAFSLGTIFEWYDFFLYGALAASIGRVFFPWANPTASFIFALVAFAAGFAVRPFGALVFARIGDRVGGKSPLPVTIVTMGLSTFLVGLLPSYAAVGPTAPAILILLRLVQGLALGGEYGGAAVCVGERAPQGKRGLYTSWIQTTPTLGLLLSLLVVLACREWIDANSFAAWGWRIPFLLSSVLTAISVFIGLRHSESPPFQRTITMDGGSSAPGIEAVAERPNLKLVLLALFGGTAGQAVVWSCGQFYALFFMTQTLKLDLTTAILMMAPALAIGTPGFILFGWLSDRVGRKPIIMLGCLLAVVTYLPLFKAVTHYANPALEAAAVASPVVIIADPEQCSLQLNPFGMSRFTSSCDVAKSALVARGIPYGNAGAPPGSTAEIRVGATEIASYQADAPNAAERATAFTKALGDALKTAGYPATADPARINRGRVIVLLVLLMIYVTLVYGPIAAMLVELFPTRSRYISVAMSYHIGNGWFGGFLPAIAFTVAAETGNIYIGLWYPITVAAMTLVIGVLFLRETKDVDIRAI